jgi:hypothetical protein
MGTFGLADAYFFRPPAHVRDPERVVRLYATGVDDAAGRIDMVRFAYSHLRGLENARLPAMLAAYATDEQSAIVGDAHATFTVAAVSRRFFDVMGVRPELGSFALGDANGGGVASVVLSDRAARRFFGGGAASLGQTVRIRDMHFRVIGVTPAGFTGGDVSAPDAWVSLEEAGHLMRGRDWRTSDAWWLGLVGRVVREADIPVLAAGTSVVLARELERTAAFARPPTVTAAALRPGSAPEVSPVGRSLILVSAAGASLLLIASVNVGCLFLLRGLERQREFAICRAIGATSGTVVRDVLAEVGILAGISTLIAAGAVLVFGEILIGGLAREAPVLMAVFRIRTAFIAASAGLAGLLVCGLVALAGVLLFPAALGSRERLGGARARGQVWLNVITAGQASATAALVAGAMLLAVNLVGLKRMEMGVDIADVTLVSVGRGYAHERPAKTEAFLQRLAARLAEEPTIESVSLAISAPFLSSVGVAVNAPDHPGVWQTKGGVPYLNAVSSNYFRGVGMRFLRGRPFTTADSLSLRKVAIINETFA